MANVQTAVYQNLTVSKNVTYAAGACPRCGNAPITGDIGGGSFLNQVVNIPLKIKVLFFKVTLGLKIGVYYCPKCGLLKLEIKG